MDGPVRTSPVRELWRLEPVGPRRYRGWCHDGAFDRVFGGQVAAQALAAAGAELGEGWYPHSLHAYFVREGRSTEPVEYRVEPVAQHPAVRVARVTASQSEQTILILDTSLRTPGPDDPWTLPAPPVELDAGLHLATWAPATPDEARWLAGRSSPLRFELRFDGPPSPVSGRRGDITGHQRFWLRAGDRLPDRALDHACAIAYASDMLLVSTALSRHGLPGRRSGVRAASIDHALWLHRPARADAWLRYEQGTPTSAGGRALTTGRLLDHEGDLVATVRQEILLRTTP